MSTIPASFSSTSAAMGRRYKPNFNGVQQDRHSKFRILSEYEGMELWVMVFGIFATGYCAGYTTRALISHRRRRRFR